MHRNTDLEAEFHQQCQNIRREDRPSITKTNVNKRDSLEKNVAQHGVQLNPAPRHINMYFPTMFDYDSTSAGTTMLM